jgi:hypothetical protein
MTTLRVFVNAAPIDVHAGATALDCVQGWRPEEAEDVRAGRRIITDSRGLPVANESAAHAGSIFRTVANRGPDAGTRE